MMSLNKFSEAFGIVTQLIIIVAFLLMWIINEVIAADPATAIDEI